MNKILMAFLATSFAAMATAQTPTPATDAAAARQQASPENVQKATAGTAKGYTQSAGEAANKAAASKDAPMVTPDAAAKQEAVKSATAGTAKGYTQAAGEQSAKAKKSKAKKPHTPKPQAGTPELNKVVP
jgi:hypothetical protein